MPGLFLIDEEERLTYEGDGFKIYYRRIDNERRARFAEQKTRMGTLNAHAFTLAILEWCIIGWDGFFRMKGDRREPIPFETSLIKYIPDDVAAKLIVLIDANVEPEVAELGN